MKELLSIIADIDSEERIEAFIENVRSSKESTDCEIILVGDAPDSIISAAKNKSSEDCEIQFIKEDESMPEGLNKALDIAKGNIITITKTSCEYEGSGIRDAVKNLSEDASLEMVSLCPVVRGVDGKLKRILKFQKLFKGKADSYIDLTETPNYWASETFAVFFKKECIKDFSFNEKLCFEYERDMLAKLHAAVKGYKLILRNVETYGFPDSDFYNYHPMYEKLWYEEELLCLADSILGIADEKRIDQRILMDFINIQFNANKSDRNKNIITGRELDDYLKRVGKVLSRIDDDIIAGVFDTEYINNPFRTPLFMIRTYLCIKYDIEDIDTMPEKTGEYSYDFKTGNGIKVASTDSLILSVKAINYRNNSFEIDAALKNAYFASYDQIDIVIECSNGTEINTCRTDVYTLRKYFGITMGKDYTFKVTIPLEGIRNASYKVSVRYKGETFYVPLHFAKPQSRFRDKNQCGYWRVAGRTVCYNSAKKQLEVKKEGSLKTVARELKYWGEILRNNNNKKRAWGFIGLRLVYFLTKPYYGRKNIWITFDQLFKGGDNGEYYYRYVSELKNKHQTIYYVVNQNTKEYKALSKLYKTVLIHSSFKNKLISLHSKIVFTTRAGVPLYLGFADSAEVYFRDLFNYDSVCLQHGLSIQQIAQYQNKTFDNLKYYFCVSKYEIANLSKPVYGYDDKSVLVLTGAPRYDGLTGTPKKQIIIAPTWRRNVTAGTNKKGSNHEYSTNFKDTAYYKIYNSLVNCKELIDCARETGYKLIYLIHPILSPQIDDFEKNDYLQIISGAKANYEKILVESAVMLTDHSGIMYDFAYQRKPLVYYHPDELPPQYAAGGLDYETMGFGPVCKTQDHVVDELCKLMRNDCRMEQKYKDRIEDFFEFDDQNNCERVYQAALEYEKIRDSGIN